MTELNQEQETYCGFIAIVRRKPRVTVLWELKRKASTKKFM